MVNRRKKNDIGSDINIYYDASASGSIEEYIFWSPREIQICLVHICIFTCECFVNAYPVLVVFELVEGNGHILVVPIFLRE